MKLVQPCLLDERIGYTNSHARGLNYAFTAFLLENTIVFCSVMVKTTSRQVIESVYPSSGRPLQLVSNISVSLTMARAEAWDQQQTRTNMRTNILRCVGFWKLQARTVKGTVEFHASKTICNDGILAFTSRLVQIHSMDSQLSRRSHPCSDWEG